MTKPDESLQRQIECQVQRMKKSERDRPTLIGQTVFLGTLGLVFVLPLILGAYVGAWLDGLSQDYSTRWTMSLIFLGLVVGGFNIYWLIRENK